MKGIIYRTGLIILTVSLVLSMSVSPSLLSRTSGLFQPPLTNLVSIGSFWNSFDPDLGIDSKGNMHIVWEDLSPIDNSGEDRDILYNMWNSSTQLWGTPIIISNTSTENSYLPIIAIDSRDDVHIVWHDYTNILDSGIDRDIFYKQWDSSAQVWSQVYLVSEDSNSTSFYPDMIIDRFDKIHITWVDYNDTYGFGNIFYLQYNPSAKKEAPILVSEHCPHHSTYPKIAIDKTNTLHVVWEDYSDYNHSGPDIDIFYNTCDVESKECGQVVVLTTDSLGNSLRPDIAYDKSGKIHVVWHELLNVGGFNYDIFYRQTEISPTLWGPIVNLSTESLYSSRDASITADDLSNVHLVWTDDEDIDGSGLEPDILYRKWDVTTEEWNNLEVVTVLSAAGSSNAVVEVDSSDNVHVAWQDAYDYYDEGMSDSDIYLISAIEPHDVETITETVTIPGETPNDTITETVTETQTDIINSTNLIEERTTVTDAKSELPLGLLPFLSALLLIPIIVRKLKM